MLSNLKKRALVLTKLSLDKVGGVEIINQQLVHLLKEHNWEVDIKCNNDLLMDEKLDSLHKYNDFVCDYFALASQLSWKEYNLVVTNNVMGGAIYPTEYTKVITLVHGLLVAGVELMAKELPNVRNNFKTEIMIEDMAYHNKSQLIAVSKQVQSELDRFFGLPSRLINNGFDFNLFSSKKSTLREEYKIPNNAIVALYCGRWELLQKRADITLELSKSFPNIIWIFAIDKALPESEKLENVLVIQNVPYIKMPALYAAADFTIQLSIYEGFSNVAMESIASKTPMISTRTGIINEIYHDTNLEFLLIDQTTAREVILEKATEKVKLLLDSFQYYKDNVGDLHPSIKSTFSIEKWKDQMVQTLDLKT